MQETYYRSNGLQFSNDYLTSFLQVCKKYLLSFCLQIPHLKYPSSFLPTSYMPLTRLYHDSKISNQFTFCYIIYIKRRGGIIILLCDFIEQWYHYLYQRVSKNKEYKSDGYWQVLLQNYIFYLKISSNLESYKGKTSSLLITDFASLKF